jgi:hypothetical protein
MKSRDFQQLNELKQLFITILGRCISFIGFLEREPAEFRTFG